MGLAQRAGLACSHHERERKMTQRGARAVWVSAPLGTLSRQTQESVLMVHPQNTLSFCPLDLGKDEKNS